MIIAIEGIDGAGKNTLTQALERELAALGHAVSRLAFPRYDDSVFAQLASKALYGQMGDLTDSIYGMATLFALDRRDALPMLRQRVGTDEVLLLDRYTASNAAYSMARAQDDNIADWIAELEFGTFELPAPDLTVLLGTPVAEAAKRAERREALDASRTRDAYESDHDLQARTDRAYRRLAETNWGSPWFVATSDVNPVETAQAITKVLFP